jgi:hypothetical protein
VFLFPGQLKWHRHNHKPGWYSKSGLRFKSYRKGLVPIFTELPHAHVTVHLKWPQDIRKTVKIGSPSYPLRDSGLQWNWVLVC